MTTSVSVLKHGRILNFCCRNKSNPKEGKKLKKNNVLNKNGSNQSSKMNYGKITGANMKNVARGYTKNDNEKCNIFDENNLVFSTPVVKPRWVPGMKLVCC